MANEPTPQNEYAAWDSAPGTPPNPPSMFQHRNT